MLIKQWRRRVSCGLYLAASLFGLLGCPNLSGAASTVITALPEAVVQGPIIQLSDVAQVQSDDADLAARLQRVILGQTPPFGVTRLLSRSTMFIQLKHQGFTVQALTFQGAQQVRVSRVTQRLSPPELEAVVRQALTQRLSRTTPAMTIRDIRGLVTTYVPPGPVHYDVLIPSRAPRAGALTFTLAIQVDGKVERQLTGTAYLVLPQEAAGKDTGSGTEAHGRQAVATLSTEGRHGFAKKPVLKSPARNTPPLVRRGDQVQIVSEATLIKVSTPGEALEAGRLGDTIRVKNTASHREVKAQVMDKHTVRVLL